ncbi:MAG: MerR family transcriptional regulator [Candidatus Nanopelagicales bacterium]
MDENFPAYVISVAAQISGLHPQTLRQYDRLGLVTPQRSGRYRLYSLRDIRRLEKVQQLTADGLNLEGIRRVLELEEQLADTRARLERYEREERSTALVVWRPRRA